MGLTVYLQHTNPHVPWFRSADEANEYGGQEELSVHVKCPRWYGLLSHEIMEHPAHHVNPLIPYYRLREAQSRLLQLLGDKAIVENAGPRYLISVMRKFKLYDYDRHEWLDFAGRATGHQKILAAPRPAATELF